MTRTIIQLYRGTTAQNDAFTGSAGELSFDTTTNQVRVHDGTTAGGHIIGSGSGYHPDLFSWQWADHELNDVQWLRADTFSWQSGAVYQAAYQHLADDIDGKTLQSETIDGYTVSFYLADDGHKICPADQETTVNQIYGSSGVAWYYIIDTVNQRFKLPRTQFGVTGLRDTVGKYVEAGLPSITHTHTSDFSSAGVSGGSNGGTGGGSWFGTEQHSTSTNSSVNSIYGNSATVQPPATQMYLYFYVGQFTQTALENTAGLNAELFNGKADLNLLNTASNVDFVIERQEPTAANNYTWYRKYKSGWVEQGGRIPENVGGTYNVSMPVEMADTNYNFVGTGYKDSNDNGFVAACIDTTSMTTTGFRVYTRYAINGSTGSPSQGGQWQVSGIAA